MIKVYIKISEQKFITDVNSEIFLSNTENYIQVDEGFGDNYAHAHGMYLQNVINPGADKGLYDSTGIPNYKYENEKIIELTEEEKDELRPKPEPIPETIDTEEALLDLDFRLSMMEMKEEM